MARWIFRSSAALCSSPRSYGSKNPGATNVLRSGNKAAAAVVTLLLDALKGWLPVVLVKWYGADYGLGDGTVAAVGLAAFLAAVLTVPPRPASWGPYDGSAIA